MSLLLQEPPTDLITVARYHEMIAAGKFDENPRVELIRGRLVEKMPQGHAHVLSTGLLVDHLISFLPSGWFLNSEKPLELADSEPEPDAAIIRGTRRDYARRTPRPADAALVVEVSDSSLGHDRRTKKELYAEGCVTCYWIVNIDDMQIEVYENPVGSDYASKRIFKPNEAVPVTLDGREIGRVSLAEIT